LWAFARRELRQWQCHGEKGKYVRPKPHPPIADGIATRVPVPESLLNLAGLMDEVLLVEDKSLVEEMRLVFRYHGLVIEPAGAAGLAAAITYKEQFQGARVATPLCGGNLTSEQIRRWLMKTE
jgi:threonine dehydratase